MGMERLKKLELIQRTLALKHKLKVHDSMEAPTSHEDMAIGMVARWELEDELKAIERILEEDRESNVESKQGLIAQKLGRSRGAASPAKKKKKTSAKR